MNDNLSDKQLAIIPISFFAANGNTKKLKFYIYKGLNVGLTINEIKEIFVHLYAYAGFPRSLNALSIFEDVLDERKLNQINDNQGEKVKPYPDNWDSLAEGTVNQTKLVGSPVHLKFSPSIDFFLKSHLFGDLFGRNLLSWVERELVTLSVLASLKGVESQLKSHYLISLNAGLNVNQLYEFINVLKCNCKKNIYENALTILEDLKINKEF